MTLPRYSGVVRRSTGRGAELGYPTANIPLGESDVSGIYIARVEAKGKTYAAAVFIDDKRRLLEAHLLDFAENLYGTEVTVELIRKVRERTDFESDTQLKSAIARDIVAVRDYFKQ